MASTLTSYRPIEHLPPSGRAQERAFAPASTMDSNPQLTNAGDGKPRSTSAATASVPATLHHSASMPQLPALSSLASIAAAGDSHPLRSVTTNILSHTLHRPNISIYIHTQSMRHVISNPLYPRKARSGVQEIFVTPAIILYRYRRFYSNLWYVGTCTSTGANFIIDNQAVYRWNKQGIELCHVVALGHKCWRSRSWEFSCKLKYILSFILFSCPNRGYTKRSTLFQYIVVV